MDKKRIDILVSGKQGGGPVAYWMSRDQRAEDNWALLHAQELALASRAPLVVAFCLAPSFLGATVRHYGFMLKGLREVESALGKKTIPFFLLKGAPEKEILSVVKKCGEGALVTDFDPLRIKREWKSAVADKIGVPFYEVDAHNIVPCRVASQKAEYGAYTLRPKIKKLIPEYLIEFPRLKKHPHAWKGGAPENDWDAVLKNLKVDRGVPEVDWIKPGARAAKKTLRDFIDKKMARYGERRNDPTQDGQSGLSPYLHFGQLSSQRVALEVNKAARGDSADAFLEELIVRRELADNFCFYNPHYDTFDGFHDWAKKTLNEHRKDKREYLYSVEQFEGAATHDELWNAAQRQMAATGKMHGYMRMYWCKKILEWTRGPEEAMSAAVYLNDKYELDGRDPNGYAGIAWSIGGVHDRAWGERPVFGKIRFMSDNGCKSKFDVKEYINQNRTRED